MEKPKDVKRQLKTLIKLVDVKIVKLGNDLKQIYKVKN